MFKISDILQIFEIPIEEELIIIIIWLTRSGGKTGQVQSNNKKHDMSPRAASWVLSVECLDETGNCLKSPDLCPQIKLENISWDCSLNWLGVVLDIWYCCRKLAAPATHSGLKEPDNYQIKTGDIIESKWRCVICEVHQELPHQRCQLAGHQITDKCAQTSDRLGSAGLKLG